MSRKTRCYHCGRVATGCRQVLRFEPGYGWHMVKLMSGNTVESVKEGWSGRYICPECYDFEVTAMHSWITFQPLPLRPLEREK